MEVVERFLGIKRRKQEKLLAQVGIAGELRRELIGSELREVSAVRVDNEKFLEVLKSGNCDEVLVHLVHQSDTHQAFVFFIDMGEGVFVKTGVTSIDYSGERDLFSDLHDLSFRYNKEESKDFWEIHRKEKV